MAILRIGDFSAETGGKAAGVQKVMVAGQHVDVPLFLINGTDPGPTFLVTAGIHGAEYASIEAALQLGRSLQPTGLHGQVIVIPVVNMPAFRARSVYIFPLDGKNLNRACPGRPDGTASEQLAYWLFQEAVKQADCYVDLHSGDLIEALIPLVWYHVSGNKALDQQSRDLARVFGIRHVLNSELIGATHTAAVQAGVPAVVAEAIGQGLWPAEAVAILTTGLNRLMRHLGMLDGPALEPLPAQAVGQLFWLLSECDGFYYLDVQVGEKVEEGQLIGRVTDFEGKVLQNVVAPATGDVLFLVSTLAINKGDTLVAVGA